MNRPVKFALISLVGFGAYYLFTAGKDTVSQWANQVTFKITSIGKPLLNGGRLSLPIHAQLVNPSPLSIPISNFFTKLYVLSRGSYIPLGETLPQGSFTIVPGENVFTFFSSIDITKLDPLTNIGGDLFQTLFSLAKSQAALLDLRADSTVNIQGFEIKQSSNQKIYFSDLIAAAAGKSSLGLVPNGKRTTTPVPQKLLALVPKAEGQNTVAKNYNADPVADTVPMILRNVKRQLWQGKDLAKALKGSTTEQTVRNDWDFIFKHIQYVEDAPGKETVRSLRRLISDGKGDCDCFVSALSNLLQNQNIRHKIRIARYNGSADYSHIYVIVPTSGGKYITVDPVVHQFNYEVPGQYKDFTV